MDAFDDAFGESPTPADPKSNGNGNGNGLMEDESDPAADFLAREQSNFAGLEDEIPEVSNATNGDLTNGNGIGEDLDAFAAGGGNNGDDFISQDRPSSPFRSSPQTVFMQREEPEKIRIWKEEQKMRLEVKDAEEEESKQKLKDAAKKELDEWYKNYDDQISKTRSSNRSAEQEGATAQTSPAAEDGKDWERIANLCDFNPKSSKQQKDISRMRSLILQLKQNPPVSRRQSSAGSSNSS